MRRLTLLGPILCSLLLSACAATRDPDPHAHVMALLEQTPLIDGHNDVPGQYLRRARNHVADIDFHDTRDLGMHTDLTRLRAGGLGGQFWSVYIPASDNGFEPGDARRVLIQMDLVKRLAARYPDHLEMAYTADDVVRIHRAGRIASMMGMEGGHAIEDSLAVLRQLYDAGARYMTLTHSRNTNWADSATDEPEHGGLTEFGREVVREMNRTGMLVDLSHVSAETMHDALDVAAAPVIFSHSGAFAVAQSPRNVPDDVLARVRENGGVVMVVFLVEYVSEELRQYREAHRAERDRLRALHEGQPDAAEKVAAALREYEAANPPPVATVQRVADHVDHIRRVAGIDHIGIGSDYDGMRGAPEGLEDASKYPNLFVELMARGYSDEDLRKIAGLNVLRVMRECEAIAERLQRERPASDALIDELDAPAAPTLP